MKVKDIINNNNPTNPAPQQQQPKKVGDLGLQVGKLKSQLQRTNSELSALKKRQEEREVKTPLVKVDGSRIQFEYTTRVQDRLFKSLETIQLHEDFEKIHGLIKPIVNITNALIRGQDIFKKSPRYEVGPDGKPDAKRRAQDAEGRDAFMPSAAERFAGQLNRLLSLPGISDLLVQLDAEYKRILDESPKRSPKTQPDPEKVDPSPEEGSYDLSR